MKRLLLSGLIVVGAISTAGLVARAYFTSQVTNSDNQITTGTLVVNVADPTADDLVIDITGLAPGEMESQYIAIVNDGSLNFKWKGYILESTDSANLSDELSVEIIEAPSEYDTTALTDAGYHIVGTTDESILADDEFNSIQDADSIEWEWSDATGYVDEFTPLDAVVYRLDIAMNEDAGDQYQTAVWKGDLTIDATQWSNLGW